MKLIFSFSSSRVRGAQGRTLRTLAAMPAPHRLALLAPMPSELRPLVRRLALRRTTAAGVASRAGRLDQTEIVATRLGVGTQRARDATQRFLDATRPDHVVVVGIAGGVRGAVALGDVIVPEAVVHEPSGETLHPVPLGPLPARGVLLTSDRFSYSPAEREAWVARGVVAFDMETAAVGQVCAARALPWSVFRAISDFAGPPEEGGTDPAVLTLLNPDGTPNLPAALAFVLRHPLRALRLRTLAAGARLAANRAADAAVAACRSAVAPEVARRAGDL